MTQEKKRSSVPFNFLMNFLLKLSGTICTAVSYPFAFRMIGETGMGRVAFATSVGSFFLMLASMGVSTYGIRECARVRDDPAALRRTARELISLQLIMTVTAELLLAAAVLSVPRLRDHRALFLIQAGILLFHGLDTEWLFAAVERYGFLALRSFCVKLVSVVLILLLGHGLNLVMGALSILVHAVRLNTLEFSNHKGVTWSGHAYLPFRRARSVAEAGH